MHEQKASALRNRDGYCIIKVRQIKAREVSKVCYKEFIADHVTFSQSGDGFVVAESRHANAYVCIAHVDGPSGACHK